MASEIGEVHVHTGAIVGYVQYWRCTDVPGARIRFTVEDVYAHWNETAYAASCGCGHPLVACTVTTRESMRTVKVRACLTCRVIAEFDDPRTGETRSIIAP